MNLDVSLGLRQVCRSVEIGRVLLFVSAMLFAAADLGCQPRRGAGAVDVPVAAAAEPDASDVARASPDDLEPGSLRAFGLLMPIATVERLSTERSRIYYVSASMPRVMRYLQRRLAITSGDIHPLGSMIRGARVRDAPAGTTTVLDVGVRDEGERTMVSIWDRTPAAAAAPRSAEDGLRAAGFDPATGRPLAGNNH